MGNYGDYHVSILTKLWMRGLFGGKYQPVEQILSDIPREHHDEAREVLEELHQDGLIIFHKDRKCASINTHYKEKVRRILEQSDDVPGYIPDLH